MIKKILLGLAALFAALALGAGIYTWDPLPKIPSAAELSADAANYNVEIIRDNWGTPHIYGTTNADTAFGVAYAHAEDDYETIQDVVAATRGVLARYKGAAAAPTDYVVALLDVWGTVDRRYEADVPADVKAIAEAYAAGLNLYAAEHPEQTWSGLAPFTGQDVIAGFILKTPFFYGFDETLQSLFAETREAPLAADPDERAWLLHPTLNTERGSNAFAVRPERSGDDTTRLLINSHQPMTGPVAWWEAHIVSEEGLDITGGLFPGTPVILHGFNRDLGWANTVSKPDLTDIYRLTINPDNAKQYRLDDEWRDFQEETALLRVKLFGPFALKVRRPVYRTEHGPVIQAPHGTYAVRYSGMNEIRQLEQYVRLNLAENWDEFSAAMGLNALPSINYVYADKDGNIAFIHNGQYPARLPGWDWQADLPGDRSDLIWKGYLPYDDGPKLVNPVLGFVYNANNTPYRATDGPDNLSAADFPASMGLQTNETNRSLRIQELADGTGMIDRGRLLAIKFDTAYAQGSEADEFIQVVLAHDWSDVPELADALAHLRAWNYHLDIDNRHAALGALTVLRHVTGQFTGDYGPEPPQAFREAAALLTDVYGRIDPEWGEVNRLVRGDVNIPVSGGPDILRAIYPLAVRPDGKLHANAGDTWIAVVEWDAEGHQSAEVVHQYGAATLDESSPHYADQAPLFASEQWRPALLTRADVEANAARTYRPGK
ncbi:MAG: acylase [Hyphomonadaceae bacterium]|nr:acylase [Hyphomonadaceae bacterium]